MKAQFITLEGSEGAGKSTNVAAICDELSHHGVPFVSTREPGGTVMAESIRQIMLEKWHEHVDGLTELMLVFAARNQHLNNVVRPALDKGQWVVCDRFTDATYAYQGYGRQLDLARIATLESWVHGDLQPSLTIYLDLDPQLAEQRIADREKDRMEQEQREFFLRVREGYQVRAKADERFITIDASQPLSQVTADVRRAVAEHVASSKESAEQ